MSSGMPPVKSTAASMVSPPSSALYDECSLAYAFSKRAPQNSFGSTDLQWLIWLNISTSNDPGDVGLDTHWIKMFNDSFNNDPNPFEGFRV